MSDEFKRKDVVKHSNGSTFVVLGKTSGDGFIRIVPGKKSNEPLFPLLCEPSHLTTIENQKVCQSIRCYKILGAMEVILFEGWCEECNKAVDKRRDKDEKN